MKKLWESIFDDATEENPTLRYSDIYKKPKIKYTSIEPFTPSMIDTYLHSSAPKASSTEVKYSRVTMLNTICNYVMNQPIQNASVSHIREFKEWFGPRGYSSMVVWWREKEIKVLIKQKPILHITFE